MRTCHLVQRNDGSQINFNQNAVIIINKESHPRGSRIFGSMPYELRTKNFIKIISLSNEIILIKNIL